MAKTVTTASTHEAFSGTFECRHCELEVTAVVHASGSGQAEGRIAEGAGHAAYKDAEDDANHVAGRTLQFVKCPRCGKRDQSGTSYRIQMTIGAFLAGAILSGITIVLAAMSEAGRGRGKGDWLWIFLVLAAVLTAGFYWRFRRPWANADRRTTFDGNFAPLPKE